MRETAKHLAGSTSDETGFSFMKLKIKIKLKKATKYHQ